jgi:hypothetical protein
MSKLKPPFASALAADRAAFNAPCETGQLLFSANALPIEVQANILEL